MLINSMTIPAIQDLIKKSFQVNLAKRGGDVRQLYIKTDGDWTSNVKRIQELDRERFAEQKVEGQKSAQRGISQGYFKDIYRKTVSITRKVSGEAYQALKAADLADMAMNTSKDVVDKIELDMCNFLGYATQGTSYVDNGGFTIDLTTANGQALFSSAHTLKNSALTYSNIISGAPTLSVQSLETAEDFFGYSVMDNYGQRMGMKPNTIITTGRAVMVNRVARILTSTSPEKIDGVANANAGVKNTYNNKFKHLVVDFDVDALNVPNANLAYYWMLACLGGSKEESLQLYYISWMSPMVAPAEIDQDAWVMSFTARSVYALGAVSGRGIAVSKATS